MWDYLGGAGAWDGRVGRLVFGFGLFVGWGWWVWKGLQGEEGTRGEDVGKKED